MDKSLQFRLSTEGRILIPARLRRQLDFEPGEDLVGRVQDGRLILESRSNVLRQLQARFDHLPSDLSLSQELIASRREENRQEEATAKHEHDEPEMGGTDAPPR